MSSPSSLAARSAWQAARKGNRICHRLDHLGQKKALAARCALRLLFPPSSTFSSSTSTCGSIPASRLSIITTPAAKGREQQQSVGTALATAPSLWLSRDAFLQTCTHCPWTPPDLRMTPSEAMQFLAAMESAGALLVVPRRSSHSPNLTDAVAAAAPLEGTEREEKDRPCIAACREKESDPPPPQARLKDPTTTWDVLLTPEALWFRVHEDQQHEEEGCSAAAAAAAAGSPIASPRTAPPLPAPALDRMERVRGLSVSSDRCGIHPWYAVPAVRRMLGMPDEDKDKFAQARSSPLLPSPPLLLSDQTLQSLRRRRELYWAKLGLALSAQLLGLGYLTFVTYGWDVMEPVCYFLTSTIALTGAALGIARTKPPRCSDGRHHGGEEGNGHAAPMTPFARTSTATMTTSSSSTGAAAAVMMGPREEEAMVVESAYFASPEAEQDAWHSAWAARTATVDDASVRWWQASEKVRGRLQ